MTQEPKTEGWIRQYTEAELGKVGERYPDIQVHGPDRRRADLTWTIHWPGVALFGQTGRYSVQACADRAEFLVWFGSAVEEGDIEVGYGWGSVLEFRRRVVETAVHVPFPEENSELPRQWLDAVSLGAVLQMMREDQEKYPVSFTLPE